MKERIYEGGVKTFRPSLRETRVKWSFTIVKLSWSQATDAWTERPHPRKLPPLSME